MTTAEPQPIRVTGLTFENPSDLLANPLNNKIHPAHQQAVVRSILKSVGWITGVVVNDVTGHILDGHDRAENAISEGQPRVPVIHCEIPEEQEPTVLLTFDPVGQMAVYDQEITRKLIDEIPPLVDPVLAAFIAGQGVTLPPVSRTPAQEVSCPGCGLRFEVPKK